ncbi:MAG: Na+/H+ antiporter NhaC family protein [Bacteroidaceae bacterium]|nr:Na+/H+ antiporter NhaC family protein [Bacteroidaceae bacterium]
MRSLSPIAVFLVVYVATSIIAGDFYKVPISVAFLITCVYAVGITRGLPLRERINLFSRGAGDANIMLMIWIFILAGAFAASAKAMGAIDATVNMALQLLPDNLLLMGLFLAACFISLSIGTSVGTVVALAPIAAGIAEATDSSVAMVIGVVVGGAFFGDNLSFISDTTIMATRTQGCRMSDKFRVNSMIVVPAACVAIVLYLLMGAQIHAPQSIPEVVPWKVLPYIAVLVTAIAGVDVMLVLLLGIALSGVIGILHGSYDFLGWFAAMGDGILGMGELIVVTMLAGGLMALIRHGGGIDFVIRHLTRHIHSRRGAELTIGGLVVLTDVCTANNTVAILTVGPIAKEIADRYGIDPRKSASLLDTFSCLAQALIPYGAQLLMAASLAAISPVEIIPYLYYPFCMGVCALLAIWFRWPRRYNNGNITESSEI